MTVGHLASTLVGPKAPSSASPTILPPSPSATRASHDHERPDSSCLVRAQRVGFAALRDAAGESGRLIGGADEGDEVPTRVRTKSPSTILGTRILLGDLAA